MPIYEYRCTACQHKLEALQKFSDAPLVTCPQCAKDTLTKLLSAAGFQLKGSGWYQTDFKGGGTKAPATTEPAAAAGDAKPAESAPAAKSNAPAAKSDAKPDAKPAATTPSAPSTP
jgi:putative FmdB family regulatory protein